LAAGVTRLVDEALSFDPPVKVAVCSTSNEKAVSQIVKMMGPERASKIQIFAGIPRIPSARVPFNMP